MILAGAEPRGPVGICGAVAVIDAGLPGGGGGGRILSLPNLGPGGKTALEDGTGCTDRVDDGACLLSSLDVELVLLCCLGASAGRALSAGRCSVDGFGAEYAED